jgi:hypothetical protein
MRKCVISYRSSVTGMRAKIQAFVILLASQVLGHTQKVIYPELKFQAE